MYSVVILIGFMLAAPPQALGGEPSSTLATPDSTRQRALVEDLLIQARRSEPDPKWFATHLRGPNNEARPLQASALINLIQRGSLGVALRGAGAITAESRGPDYTRFILDTTPPLTVVIQEDEGRSPRSATSG